MLRRDELVLRVGDQIMLDLELQIGAIAESVNVTAAAPLLQSSRGRSVLSWSSTRSSPCRSTAEISFP